MPRLEATIRALHWAEGSVDETIAREYHLVVGAGSTNVLTALLFAAASEGPADPSMFVRAPHWFHYSHLAAMNLPFGLHWATTPANATIHINTWPNNPDGSVHPVSAAADATTIVDCAYNWRSWGAEQVLGSAGVDAALFTLSKLTGHAGTRFGWALVRDEALAASARRWLGALQLQPASNLAIAQALRLLTPLADGSASLLVDTRAVMKERAVALAAAEAACSSPRATNEAAVGFFYAWFRCTQPADARDCAGALAAAVGVHGHFGADFGATNASVRIPLVQHTPVWQQSTLPRLSRFLCP
jgi:aspartate/methionine/tyrosine aminotransferase